MIANIICILLVSLLVPILLTGAFDPLEHLTARCKRQAASVCLLIPENEEGPYYWNTTMYRSNITEDRAGIPLHLTLTVIDINNCSVLPNAAIDVWHCDALGVYSHYIAASLGTGSQNDNSTFLRGIQLTSSAGVATFDTIYPGWYGGRADHIHIKVHLGGLFVNSTGVYSGGHVSHTGQLFMNDTLTDLIKATSPYSNNTNARTYNSVDRVYTQQNGSYSLVTLSYVNASVGLSAGIIGSITLGINSSATPTAVTSGGSNGGSGGPSSISSSATVASATTTTTIGQGSAASPSNRAVCFILFVALFLLNH